MRGIRADAGWVSPGAVEEEGEKREPEGRLTDGRASWPDVSVLLCAALAMSIMAVAWGIFVLLTAASTVVLEFGGRKGEREPVPRLVREEGCKRHQQCVSCRNWELSCPGSFTRFFTS